MKEIIVIYDENCITSENILNTIKKWEKKNNFSPIKIIPFSFEEPLVKKFKVLITPTFIIDNKVAFVGIPNEEELLDKIKINTF